MRILAPGSREVAPTLVASRTALPPEGALRLRPGKAGSAAPAGGCGSGAVRSSAPSLGTGLSSLTAPRRRILGFTLLELLVVISIIAIGSAGVVFAMRDSAQTALEREGDRLVALLEAGRALSRTSGQVMRWRDTPEGFVFEGANAGKLPSGWQSPQSAVRWDAGPNPHILTLGPEPIIEAQAITLINEGRSLRIATDGLRPFAVLPPAP
jgi:general secretion pathway protein H